MNTYISASEYLGIMVQGGNIFYFLINAIFLFFILPKLQPQRNTVNTAIHKSLGLLLVIYLVNYSLWIVPELFQPSSGYYQISRVYPAYNTLLEYLDLAILPLSMLFGATVLLGRIPRAWVYISIMIPYSLFALNDIYEVLPFKLYRFTYISTIVLNAAQLAWYGYFIQQFDKKLKENCSNLEHRSPKWVFWTLVCLFILTLLYIPLNILTDKDEYMILYDLLTFIFLSGIVGCALTHKVDDMTIDLIKEQIEDLKPEEDDEEEPAQPAAQNIQGNATTTEAGPTTQTSTTPAGTTAETVAQDSQAGADTKQATTASKFTNFDKTIQKLEEEKFYLDTEVNIDWISSKLGTNRHYVSDYLNQIKHVTFYEYVNTLRLTHAERLLKEGKEKVSDIAFISGFNSDHTFRRLFKEKYGCTPLQYQRGCLK